MMLSWFVLLCGRLGSDEEGASMVEYALLVSLIAIVAFIAVQFAGDEVSGQFSNIANELENAGG